jgi:hypothetical protein
MAAVDANGASRCGRAHRGAGKMLAALIALGVAGAAAEGAAGGLGGEPGFHARGDADCSVGLGAADVVASVAGVGGQSRCGNDDCERDGDVDAADVACAARCLFGRCPVPAHAPVATAVRPQTAEGLAPFSVARVEGGRFGSEDQLKRVTIGGATADVVRFLPPDAIEVVVPGLPPGPAEVIVFDGQVGGLPLTVTIAGRHSEGALDGLEETMALMRAVVDLIVGLDLEPVFADDTALVIQMLDHAAREGLNLPFRLELLGVGAEMLAELDAALESSGMADDLRALIDELEALPRAALVAGGAPTLRQVLVNLGGKAYRLPTVLQRIIRTLAPLLEPSSPEIAVAMGNIARLYFAAGAVVLAGTGARLALSPVLEHLEFFDPGGGESGLPLGGGTARVRGRRLGPFPVALRIATQSGTFDATEISSDLDLFGAGTKEFRLPGRVGFCGPVVLFLARTGGANSVPVPAYILPFVVDLLGPDTVRLGQALDLEVTGVVGCDATARWYSGLESVPSVFSPRSTTVTPFAPNFVSVSVPNLPQGVARLLIDTGFPTIPVYLDFDSGIRDLRVVCENTELPAGETTVCEAVPLPDLTPKIYPELMRFEWESNRADVIVEAPTTNDPFTSVLALLPGHGDVSVRAFSNDALLAESSGAERIVVTPSGMPGFTRVTFSISLYFNMRRYDGVIGRLTESTITTSGLTVSGGSAGSRFAFQFSGSRSRGSFTGTLSPSGDALTTFAFELFWLHPDGAVSDILRLRGSDVPRVSSGLASYRLVLGEICEHVTSYERTQNRPDGSLLATSVELLCEDMGSSISFSFLR